MAADIRGLMQFVYDFFLQAYNSAAPGVQAGTFLAFEKIGQPVLPGDFKIKPDDPNFSPEMARERTSRLGNAIPQIASNFVLPTDRLVDDTYSMLLIGSMPTGTQDEITFCANLKAEANKRFRDSELESLLGMSRYHPCDATPIDWYDPSKAAWPNFSKKTEPATTTPPASAHPIQYNPTWRLQPTSAEVTSVLTKHALLTPAVVSAVAPEAVRTDAPSHVMMTHAILTPAGDIAAAKPAVVGVAVPAPAVGLAVDPALSAAPAAPPAVTTLAPRIALPLRGALLRDLVAMTPEKPVSSDELTFSFSYCIVRLQRPWLYQPFLDCRSWYVPGSKQGDFSTGTEEASSGTFAALPVAFLVIRDLSIVANWTGDDGAAAKDSLALPPFSLVGSTFEGETLSCLGMQVIAWICQAMPLLPPGSAPQA